MWTTCHINPVRSRWELCAVESWRWGQAGLLRCCLARSVQLGVPAQSWAARRGWIPLAASGDGGVPGGHAWQTCKADRPSLCRLLQSRPRLDCSWCWRRRVSLAVTSNAAFFNCVSLLWYQKNEACQYCIVFCWGRVKPLSLSLASVSG